MAADKDCVKLIKIGNVDVPVPKTPILKKTFEDMEEAFNRTEGREELREPKLKGGRGE